MPSLQGVAEPDPASRTGGETLTDKRRKLVINLSPTHVPHLAGTAKPKKLGGVGEKISLAYNMFKVFLDKAWSKMPEEWKRDGAVVYDFAILISTTCTFKHIDELPMPYTEPLPVPKQTILGDGGGIYVNNVCLAGDGVMAFEMEGDKTVPLFGVYVGANQYTIFGQDLKIEAQHQVLRFDHTTKLSLKSKIPSQESRIVATVRYAPHTKKMQKRWEYHYGENYRQDREEQAKEMELVELKAQLTKSEKAVTALKLAANKKETKVTTAPSGVRAVPVNQVVAGPADANESDADQHSLGRSNYVYMGSKMQVLPNVATFTFDALSKRTDQKLQVRACTPRPWCLL
jgi:hypothetical protein